MQPLKPTDPTELGRYRITGRLGSGGMGSVYLGLSPGGRPAAIKVIHESFQEDPDALARFRREVDTLRTVRSAYTAALIDSRLDQAPYWLATEYVLGPTLHAAVTADGPFTTANCYSLFAALAEGLTDIHDHGICHRDLKPRNIILAATGPQLIDFGIARRAAQTGITQLGQAVGTPGYTAPEVLTHNQVGPAADIFALGVTIAYAATGRPPYGEGSVTAVSLRALSGQIDLTGADPQLAGLIRSCVAVDPAHRPTPEAVIAACHQRTTAPAAALPPAGTTTVQSSRAPVAAGTALYQPSFETAPTHPAYGPEPRSWTQRLGTRAPVLIGGLGVLIVVLLVVVLMQLGNDDPGSSAAAPAASTAPVEATEPESDDAPPDDIAPTHEKIPQTARDATTDATTDPDTETEQAPQTPAGDPSGQVKMSMSGDDYCAEMPDNAQPYDAILLERCDGSSAQEWAYTGWQGLRQGQTCMDMGPDNELPGQNQLRAFPCNETEMQQFPIDDNGYVISPKTGFCLAVGDGMTGFALTMVKCGNGIVRTWRFPTRRP